MKRISIRSRITLWNTIAFAVVLVGFGFLVYGLLRKAHYDQIDRQLLARYEQIVEDPQLSEDPLSRLQYWIRRFSEHFEIHGFVVDASGFPIAGADRMAEFSAMPSSKFPAGKPHFDSFVSERMGKLRRLSVTVHAGNQNFGLVLFAELEHVDEELSLVIRALVPTIPLTLLLAASVAYLLAVKALAPVQKLCQQADEISADKLDRRLPVPNPHDELGHLARTVNSMIGRLQRSFEEIKRFTGDASHELRTPVAIIRSEAEMGTELARGNDATLARFQSILEECGRLTAMTGQLLQLSREDAGVGRTPSLPIDVRQVLDNAVTAYRPLAEAKEQELTVRTDADVNVAIDAQRLEQVLHNLLDNAIKYTPRGGHIHARIKCDHECAVIEVQDSGVGIAPEDRDHVFDRFYRARSNGESEGSGAGLGLSIVQSIVSAEYGRVEIESEVGKGSQFRVILPAVSPECRS